MIAALYVSMGNAMKWIVVELGQWWREYAKPMQLFAAVALIAATCLIIVTEEYGQARFYRAYIHFGRDFSFHRLMPHLYWFSSSALFYGLVPMLLILGFRKKPKAFGLQLGDWRLGLKILALFAAVMIVVVYFANQTESFARHYPLNKYALKSLSFFLLYESFYVLYFFAWEFFFRGFLLFALYPAIGAYAIVVQMIPFALLHIGKPVPEVFASVFAGLILGALALRTRSMLYCWLLHAISAVAMDLAVFIGKGQWIWS